VLTHRDTHGEAVDKKRRGIVEQALTFENHDHAMRNMQLAKYGRRRGRIRWRDDGAERDGRGPGHVGNQRVHEQGHGKRGDADSDDDQGKHGNPEALQIAQRGIESRIEQHRRHEQRERELRMHRELGRVGEQCEAGAAEREEGRVGKFEITRAGGEQYGGHQQDQQPLKDLHAEILRG